MCALRQCLNVVFVSAQEQTSLLSLLPRCLLSPEVGGKRKPWLLSITSRALHAFRPLLCSPPKKGKCKIVELAFRFAMLACPAAQMKRLRNQRKCFSWHCVSLVTVATGSCYLLLERHIPVLFWTWISPRLPDQIPLMFSKRLFSSHYPKEIVFSFLLWCRWGSPSLIYQTVNAIFVCFAISEFITNVGCGYI